MNSGTYSDSGELLKLINSGYFDTRQVLELAYNMKREREYLDAIKNKKIWKGKGKDTRWKFKTADGKIVARKEEEDIKSAYLDYLNTTKYGTAFAEISKSNMTYKMLFDDWLEYKHKFVGTEDGNLSPTTYRRYQRDYEKYIGNTSFSKMSISEIKPVTIEMFLKDMVDKYKLTNRGFNNVSGYIRASFEYAYKSDYLDSNPFDKVNIDQIRRCCKSIPKEDCERTLTTKEIQKLLTAVHKAQRENELYMPNYAIELSILTGMRVGEISALKWECVDDEKIVIKFAERRFDYKGKTSEIVIGDTKNHKHRQIPMSKEARDLFKRIKAVQKKANIESEFVFSGTEGRYNEHSISQAVYRRCADAGIDKKSIHSIRRTVSSNLRAVLPAAVVSNMLGHTERTNESYYNYDTLTMNCKKEALDSIQSGFYDNESETTA